MKILTSGEVTSGRRNKGALISLGLLKRRAHACRDCVASRSEYVCAVLELWALGLAALLIVLTIATLSLKIDPARERLLRLILYLGTFCFVAALVAQYVGPMPPPPVPPQDFSK
jgi:hypothetical protein